MKSTRWLYVCLALGYGVYLAQMFGPLQMTFDSIGYLSLAAAAADSRGLAGLWEAIGGDQTISTGYPAMIAGLEGLGLARPWALVGLNCAFLLLALIGTYCLGRRAFDLTKPSALVVCLLTLLNSTLVRHGPLVLSDVAFAGLALCSLAAMVWQEECGEAFDGSIVLASLLALAATLVRSIGIVLFIALAVCMVRIWLQHRQRIRTQPLVVIRAVVAIVIAMFALLVGSSRVDLQACKLEYSIVSPK